MNRIVDIRDVLGMRTVAAFVLLTCFASLQLVAVFVSLVAGQSLPVLLVAWLVFVSAFLAVALLPGDPLPLPSKLFLLCVGPVGAALGYSQLPVPQVSPMQSAFVASSVAYLTFTCVRGASAWAWGAFALVAAVGTAWGLSTGQGWSIGAVTVLTNVAPIMMATYFGRTVRPTTHSILILREQGNLRAAGEAAATAALQERDEQLDRLDAIARPMLDVIASGRQLSPTEQTECCLIEAELRDRLRGSRLVDDDVAAAARAARSRGATVVLLDDGGLDDAAPAIADIVRATTRSVLDRMSDGTVSARVLPPGRTQLVAIIGRHGDAEFHVDVAPDGSVRSDIDLPTPSVRT